MTNIGWTITGIESGTLTTNQGPDINSVDPDKFLVQQGSYGAQIFCIGKPYAGALAAAVNPLVLQSPTITFKYTVTLDASIANAQVIETDTKVTDAAGWTYDGSLQFNIIEGWMIQLSNPWGDTGIKLALKQGANPVTIVYALDYTGHTITVKSVNGISLGAKLLPAQQIGWQKSSIVTQLQLCLGAAGGAYDLIFNGISYTGQ